MSRRAPDLWAPAASSVALDLDGRRVPLSRDDEGWWRAEVPLDHGVRYGFVVDGSADTTLSSGYYPHLLGGVDMRLTDRIDLLLEGRYDFNKEDGPLEFDSAQIQAGVRLDFGWQ